MSAVSRRNSVQDLRPEFLRLARRIQFEVCRAEKAGVQFVSVVIPTDGTSAAQISSMVPSQRGKVGGVARD